MRVQVNKRSHVLRSRSNRMPRSPRGSIPRRSSLRSSPQPGRKRDDGKQMFFEGVQPRGIRSEHSLEEVESFDELFEKF